MFFRGPVLFPPVTAGPFAPLTMSAQYLDLEASGLLTSTPSSGASKGTMAVAAVFGFFACGIVVVGAQQLTSGRTALFAPAVQTTTSVRPATFTHGYQAPVVRPMGFQQQRSEVLAAQPMRSVDMQVLRMATGKEVCTECAIHMNVHSGAVSPLARAMACLNAEADHVRSWGISHTFCTFSVAAAVNGAPQLKSTAMLRFQKVAFCASEPMSGVSHH